MLNINPIESNEKHSQLAQANSKSSTNLVQKSNAGLENDIHDWNSFGVKINRLVATKHQNKCV